MKAKAAVTKKLFVPTRYGAMIEVIPGKTEVVPRDNPAKRVKVTSVMEDQQQYDGGVTVSPAIDGLYHWNVDALYAYTPPAEEMLVEWARVEREVETYRKEEAEARQKLHSIDSEIDKLNKQRADTLDDLEATVVCANQAEKKLADLRSEIRKHYTLPE